MILTDEEVQERLESPENLISRLEDRKKNSPVLPMVKVPCKQEGDTTLPSGVRELVGRLSNLGDKTSVVAAEFGISKTTVNKSRLGLVDDRLDSDLAVRVKAREEKEEKAHDLALDALVSSIGKLTTNLDRIEKPEKLSKIARDMSSIIGSIKGTDKDSTLVKPQVIIYAPQIKQETQYETIDV